jgi:hypothetical protein
MGMMVDFDEEGLLTNVRWDALQAQSLETSPAEYCRVHGSKFAKIFGDVFVLVGAMTGGR